MDAYIEQLSPEEWEQFCEIMLRRHFTPNNFVSVPDEDRGDLGLEFYTIQGTLFQCYYPDKGIEMSMYKSRVQRKIRNDLKKLTTNESEISEILDDVTIDRWVLLIPEMKSKELIKYCNKKKNELLQNPPSFVDKKNFRVKIDTADSYLAGKLYAMGVHGKAIDYALAEVSTTDKESWQADNSKFAQNIDRKSNFLMGSESSKFQDKVVTKYIQIEKLLDHLREDHPDLYHRIEDSARAQLQNMSESALFESNLDQKFVQDVLENNSAAFSKHSEFMSDTNIQSLSFGYLSKWLAECYMDFESV